MDREIGDTAQLEQIRQILEQEAFDCPALFAGAMVELPIGTSLRLLVAWNKLTEIVRDRFRDELARIGYTPREITEVCAGRQIKRFETKNKV